MRRCLTVVERAISVPVLASVIVLADGCAVNAKTVAKTPERISTAAIGVAYYAGAPGETGISFFDRAWFVAGDEREGICRVASPTSVLSFPGSVDAAVSGFNRLDPTAVAAGAELNLWKSINDVPTVVCSFHENVRAGFTLMDGLTPATIPDKRAYTLEASWDVPANPIAKTYGSGELQRDARCCIGIQFDGSAQNEWPLSDNDSRRRGIGWNPGLCAFGIEWTTELGYWRIISHNRGYWGYNEKLVPPPKHFAVRIVKRIAAKSGVNDALQMAYPADAGLVTVYFSVDDEPWMIADSAYGRIADFPLGSYNDPLDEGPDYIAYSIRGNSALNLRIAVYGEGVPNVNTPDGSLDFDGDGISNTEEIRRGTSVVFPDAKPGPAGPQAKRK